MKISEAIKDFLIYQEIQNNTPKTIKNYIQNLGYFVEFLGDKNIKEISVEDINNYILYLKKKPKNKGHKYKNIDENEYISSVTLQSYIRHLRAFLSYCYKEDFIDFDLSSKVVLPKSTKKVIDILTEDEILAIYKYCKGNRKYGTRNTLIISLMLDSGLRINEVATIKLDNIYIKEGIIKVFGKGRKERFVPIGNKTKRLLNRYITMYRIEPDIEKYKPFLFIDNNGKPISKNAITNVIRRIKKALKFTRLYPHLFRHTFATRYLINGGDITSLKMILGHTSLKIVENYLHIANQYTIQKYRKHSILDGLEGI